MNGLSDGYKAMLERILEAEYVPHLPPLLDNTKPAGEVNRKNFSRAFSAFALRMILKISPQEAAEAVIDDFNDASVDAIYYDQSDKTIYVIQSKMKQATEFKREDALGFCDGVRRFIKQDYDGFNLNVQRRKQEITTAFYDCGSIHLVVAHIGPKVSEQARKVFEEFLLDQSQVEPRLHSLIDYYDEQSIIVDLQNSQAYSKIDSELLIEKCQTVKSETTNRTTYVGLISLFDLVQLHIIHEKGLYQRNIRRFLGTNTEVNVAIKDTLSQNPNEFFFLNNGVTALCHTITRKGKKGDRQGLEVTGLLVVNGAQTIASATKYVEDNPGCDISMAKVLLTLIEVGADEDFSKNVTRARNHQNPVRASYFVALEDEQERIRRELAYWGIEYIYQAQELDESDHEDQITVAKAASALALLQPDPRYVLWTKIEASRLLNTETEQYKALFSSKVTVFQIVNCVRTYDYVMERMRDEARGKDGQEGGAYKHGDQAIAWILAKKLRNEINSARMFDPQKLREVLSVPFDDLRKNHWTVTEGYLRHYLVRPRAIFTQQTRLLKFLEDLMVADYGLGSDPIVRLKRQDHLNDEPYPVALFDYLMSRAPQIEGLT